jgi:hypothetical protein
VGLQIILDSVKAQVENLDKGQCKAGERDARPGRDARGEGGASPMARPCDWRVSARLSLSFVCLFRHTMRRKAAPPAEITDISGHRRSEFSLIDHLCGGRHSAGRIEDSEEGFFYNEEEVCGRE